jgi:hypothetical protein
MVKRLNSLTTFWFLIPLVLLLLNDFFFKEFYGNWITGKLSDFTGLFIYPIFWTVLFPKHKTHVFWITGILFIFWKSTYSQPFIDHWNSFDLLTISRVVDYSDLFALLVLPFAFRIESRLDELPKTRLNPIIPLLVSTFAFAATSEGPNRDFTEASDTFHVSHYSRDSLIYDLENCGIDIRFYEYNDEDKYVNEHADIHNLSDSISSLTILIGHYNKSFGTVEIRLAHWEFGNAVTAPEYDVLDKIALKYWQAYVRVLFRNEVVRKIEKARPTM